MTDDRLVTYVKCEPDGTIVTVGFYPNGTWWMPIVRRYATNGMLRASCLLGPIQCSDPYYQPERFVERSR